MNADRESLPDPSVKVVGQLHASPLERFNRLQRNLARITPPKLRLKRIERFRSYEEMAQWPRCDLHSLDRSGSDPVR